MATALFSFSVVQGFQRACLREQQRKESHTRVCYEQRQNRQIAKSTNLSKGTLDFLDAGKTH